MGHETTSVGHFPWFTLVLAFMFPKFCDVVTHGGGSMGVRSLHPFVCLLFRNISPLPLTDPRDAVLHAQRAVHSCRLVTNDRRQFTTLTVGLS